MAWGLGKQCFWLLCYVNLSFWHREPSRHAGGRTPTEGSSYVPVTPREGGMRYHHVLRACLQPHYLYPERVFRVRPTAVRTAVAGRIRAPRAQSLLRFCSQEVAGVSVCYALYSTVPTVPGRMGENRVLGPHRKVLPPCSSGNCRTRLSHRSTSPNGSVCVFD